MYIHIGNDITLIDKWIVAVLDMDKSTASSPLCREFLTRAEKEGKLQWIGPEIPRSIVVTLERVYLTPVSSETLLKRFSDPQQHQIKDE